MGAVLLHDAVWVLPATPQTRENFQWLAAEILEGGSEAVVWEAHFLLPGQDEELAGRFLAHAEEAYRMILHELAGEDPDIGALARRYQGIQTQDYFRSELGDQVRQALMAAPGVIDS
jgi:hypothetical protein